MSTAIPGRRKTRGYSTEPVTITVSGQASSSSRVTLETAWEGNSKYGKVKRGDLFFLDRKAFIAAALEQIYALELVELGVNLADLKKMLEFYREGGGTDGE